MTTSNIHRAKGHEAWKVYVCRFHYADLPYSNKTILHKRNEAFTALTRSKAWCVVTGFDRPVIEELKMATIRYPNFSFPAFNKKSLKRVTNDENTEDPRKKRVSKLKLKNK